MILTTASVQLAMISAEPTPVHTTGVNWVSVSTIIVGITVVMSAILGLAAKYIASKVTGSINQLRVDVVDKLDTRLSIVENTLQLISRNNPDRREK